MIELVDWAVWEGTLYGLFSDDKIYRSEGDLWIEVYDTSSAA